MSELTPEITITQDGESRSILMSYGLVNELAKAIGSPDRLNHMIVDHDLRDDILLAILAERTPTGKIVKEFDEICDVEISIADMDRVLTWGNMHIADFFMKRMATISEVDAHLKATTPPDVQTMMTALASSLNDG